MNLGDIDFLFDAQLPPALARAITEAVYSAQHVADVGLSQTARSGTSTESRDEGVVAIRLIPKDGVTVVWLRIRNSSTQVLLAWFMLRLPEIVALIEAGEPLIELR